MTISLVRESAAARSLAAAALTDRLPKDFGAHPAPGTLAVLPLYSIPNDHMLSRAYHHSWCWGWRYFWLHPDFEKGAVVDIRRTRGGRAKLQRYATGTWVQRVTSAMAETATRHALSGERLRPRILRLPEIQMEAFWLSPATREGGSYFKSLLDSLEDDAFAFEASRRIRELVPEQGRHNKRAPAR